MKKRFIRIATVPVSFEKLLSGQLSFMNSYYEVIAVSSKKKKLERLGLKKGVNVFHVGMTRKITPFRDISAIVKLFLFFKKQKPFIVHTHTPKAGLVGMVAAKMAGVPHRLHTVAGLPLLETTGAKRKVLDLVEKLVYSCATKVYPNSFGLLDIINQNNYCSANKLRVLCNGSSNGIDTAYFNPDLFREEQNLLLKEELNIAKDDFVFIFVGRLVRDKGINELIVAFELLQNNKKNVKLLLVGGVESDLDPLLPYTLDRLSNNSSIIWVGFQKEVRGYFAVSNALVFPSYREGFPNVVMQAGAMGLPAIVSDINGCNEIIADGENGIITPPKNVDAFYLAMKKLTENNSLMNDLKQNARPMIVSRFEQKMMWEALLNEYQKLEK